ncbi:MAG TPA: SOS response-associated peptidase [Gammaproteobacteria bacterium]|jgi:putative SOS response-associated peptidase YedK|nr:SOS response-associated peptidase [Gammaproteobacteria bacterium]
MCGRFTIRNTSVFQTQFDGEEITPSFNIAPGQKIAVMTEKLHYIKWGFTPFWAEKPFNLVNARSETLSTKPSFENSGRCLIPADGWYEWKGEGDKKIPFFHHLDGEAFCFGGVYGGYRGEVGCAIVTTSAVGHLKHIHERMPYIVQRSHYKDWLQSNELISFDEVISNKIEFYPVSTYVNNPNHNDKNCVFEVQY